ncbi:MAG: FAD-dependent oxidoreductase, partial [Pseudomonadota bacterium]
VPVHTQAAVRAIDWRGTGVRVDASTGSLRAKAVIVTASTGVLASGTIRFTPELPVEKTEAFHAFRMGAYNNIGLRYREDVFGLGATQHVIPKAASVRQPPLSSNLDGTGLSMVYVGGDLSRELQAAGVEAAIDFGVSYVDDLLGSDTRKRFVNGAFFCWEHHSWTRGSYFAPLPGALMHREALRRPVGERVFFAGDACHDGPTASVSRAHDSGVATAREVLTTLGA